MSSRSVEPDTRCEEKSIFSQEACAKNPKSMKIVIKIGSSSISSADGRHMNMSVITGLVEVVKKLMTDGHKVVLVTSGAVSVGCSRMNLAERPKDLTTKKAIAAVGQSRLMRVYDDFFSMVEQPIAQVLLSRENLSKSHHYRNALNTFSELLRLNIVPIVNENDTVAVEELRVGDNDTLSALVASLIEADYLFLLTDVDALYTDNPNTNPDAKPIHVVRRIEDLQVNLSNGESSWGTGGMGTKIVAAKVATAAGVRTVITRSSDPNNVLRILSGEKMGTHFLPHEKPIKGRRKWIAHGLQPSGSIFLNGTGLQSVLENQSLHLEAVAGVTKVENSFPEKSNVSIRDEDTGKEIARGLVNFSSEQLNLLITEDSCNYSEVLGCSCDEKLIHQDNLVLLESTESLRKKSARR